MAQRKPSSTKSSAKSKEDTVDDDDHDDDDDIISPIVDNDEFDVSHLTPAHPHFKVPGELII